MNFASPAFASKDKEKSIGSLQALLIDRGQRQPLLIQRKKP
ncbi:hypothetical protein SynBIOSE41_01408 [Synechococcus sp. BIOS-E4-1]|nr:hypothetical protein SynBIOSE41_01408 [Synechococcus sp. BIOS-E4-1]